MKFLLKLILFPVWILVKLIALFGNLLTHCACFAFNLLFICIAISVVMSIAQGLWTTLFILLGIKCALITNIEHRDIIMNNQVLQTAFQCWSYGNRALTVPEEGAALSCHHINPFQKSLCIA